MIQEFKAKKGISVIVITTLIFALFCFLMFLYSNSISNENVQSDSIAFLVVSIIILILIFYSFLLAPKKYIVTESSILIKRFIKKIEISIDNITDIQQIPNKEGIKFIRSLGIGGLFGHIGKYYHKKYKHVIFYASRMSNMVLIKTNSGDIVITPNDLSFIKIIKEKMNK